MARLILITILLSFTPVHADPATATAQLRARFEVEWHTLADAPKLADWRITYRGREVTGDWVVSIGAYRYFIQGDRLRCQIQEDKYMSCGGGEASDPSWTAHPARSRASLAAMTRIHRAIYGNELALVLDDDLHGHATVETVVTSGYEQRTSRRYRAELAVDASSFTLGVPKLVEEFRETCFAISGCHSTHWSCRRLE